MTDANPEDQRLRDAVLTANIPVLLMILVQFTGALRWLDAPYAPTRSRGFDDNDSGGLPDDIQQEIREAAADAILAWRAGEPMALPLPDDALLTRMMGVCMGENVPLEYAPILREELALALGAEAPQEPTPERVPLSAIVIGAGVTGIAAAHELQRLGMDFVVLERNSTIGGVWLENHYPGAGIDTPSHIFTFSFAPNRSWRHFFSLRDEIAEYLDDVARQIDLESYVQFDTNVLSADYDEEAQSWTVTAERRGETIVMTASVLISAVGAFNKPTIPNFPGRDDFEGIAFHTARWPEGLDIRGKRVAVVGTGASAMQIVPAIVDQVSQLTVFQRSPQWTAPFEKFQQEIPESTRYLLETIPLYYTWYRLRLGWAFNDKLHAQLIKDPTWSHPERSLNSRNDGYRKYFTEYIVEELGERQDLLGQVLPDYPPFGKRMLMDNGWYRAIQRDNVTLVNHAVARVTPTGLVADNGEQFPADIIVYSTGYDVVHFVAPIEIRGRGSVSLQDFWDGDNASAYLGALIPGFPNFFCLYGPNTQFGHGGSLITVMERQMHYVSRLLSFMGENDLGALEVSPDAFDEYTAKVDAAHENMIWTHPGIHTYYRNSRGRVVVSNPFRIVDFWKWTDDVDPRDMIVERRGRTAALDDRGDEVMPDARECDPRR